MTSPQHKIGSGFGRDTTAAEVLKGVDLAGRLAVVTGGYSGLGLETTRALSDAGADIIVGARRPDTARAAVDGIDRVELSELDLSDLDSVAGFADGILDGGRGIDLMINSAGIMACPEARVGDGWESQFATNHLGHFALVNRLWPALRPGSRVVAVSSAAHRMSGIRWDDIHFTADAYDRWLAYGQSKTANALFALELDRRGEAAGVRAFSLHPGGILTPLQRHMSEADKRDLGWVDENGNARPELQFKTPEAGAATQVWAATSPRLDGMGGVYCEDCDIAEPAVQEGARGGVHAHATDPEQAARLWELSAELTGVDAFA
ncbi:MAG TPA: SDR family NAD(P)-dependent oxidoreductase [Stackebrandtia sp.]|jgi:NAD(P)-dependent dehydrogenase (short-subunit alcohol dehydrogenase family)|uniref:SDR family NAD(P)-dependent oxidoreductase n=1 Tax=Stackebrandtia sp. TaxID=2023065 RepID=UPI002D64ABE0|nr:SDR family NAD(P)-dependent oxidoreductase [Stackebrandtia sp.]HZE41551.1 SDR family NAD(P)-dependent oxidoreductase [Stackebrandtia sp.]